MDTFYLLDIYLDYFYALNLLYQIYISPKVRPLLAFSIWFYVFERTLSEFINLTILNLLTYLTMAILTIILQQTIFKLQGTTHLKKITCIFLRIYVLFFVIWHYGCFALLAILF